MKVNQAFAEAEWETKKDQFPGVEISFGSADDAGMADLEVEGADVRSIAAALRCEQVAVAVQKPEQPAVAADFIDHGQETRLAQPRSTDKSKEVGAAAGSQTVETEKAAPKSRAAKKK